MEQFCQLKGFGIDKLNQFRQWNLFGTSDRTEVPLKDVAILKWNFQIEDEPIPHLCVRVFHKYYEYSPFGIQISAREKLKFEDVSVGTTELEQNDFERWLFRDRHIFSEEKFDIANNNSITFAQKCCQQLGVPFPTNFTKLNSTENTDSARNQMWLDAYARKVEKQGQSSLFRS